MTGGVLADRIVVISGVGPGLGRAIAEQCARAGADLVLASRTETRLQDVADDVRSLGRRALVVPTDIDDDARPSTCSTRPSARSDTWTP